jgi:hypothetical protein
MENADAAQPFADMADVPLSFELADDATRATAEPCRHVLIKNSETGTKIECHSWGSGHLSCHMIVQSVEGANTGLIFNRENQQSDDVELFYPSTSPYNSVFYRSKVTAYSRFTGETRISCSEPIQGGHSEKAGMDDTKDSAKTALLELESSVGVASDSGLKPFVKTAMEEAISELPQNDESVTAIKNMKNAIMKVIEAGLVGATRAKMCGVNLLLSQASESCGNQKSKTMMDVCMEDQCIPGGEPDLLKGVTDIDASMMARVVDETKERIDGEKQRRAVLVGERGQNAWDVSSAISKATGEAWFNKCPDAKGLVTLSQGKS